MAAIVASVYCLIPKTRSTNDQILPPWTPLTRPRSSHARPRTCRRRNAIYRGSDH